ncbi:MAG: hydantoinase B/oxoprolinase family protein, partial [Bacteroidota bacterium]
LISQHRQEAPYGLAGGESGKRGKQYLVRTDGQKTELKGIDQIAAKTGECLVIETPGGGGFGVAKEQQELDD